MKSIIVKRVCAVSCFVCVLVVFCVSFAGTVTRVSVDSDGSQSNNNSILPSTSADGRFIAFQSTATNLVPGDVNGFSDIFVHDRMTGTTELISKSNSGELANSHSYSPSISGDGRFVAYESSASNLFESDMNGVSDIFIHDRLTGKVELISKSSTGVQANRTSSYASISANGRFVAFQSYATNLAKIDYTNWITNIFVHDRITGKTELISMNELGISGNYRSSYPSISGEGRYVTFMSGASNLVANDVGQYDIFLYDRYTGQMKLLSITNEGRQASNCESVDPKITTDGKTVVFACYELIPGSWWSLYIKDVVTGSLENIVPNEDARDAHISADGRFVAYSYQQGGWQGFLLDRNTSTTKSLPAVPKTISADAGFIGFYTQSPLVANDTNGFSDVYVFDRSTIQVTRALFDYVLDELTVEATSVNGATDNLAVSGYGPMTWNPLAGTWQFKATNVTKAPESIFITGNSGNKIVQ